MDKKSLYRIIDANFNRAKEGLRVCEDVCRFILNKKSETKLLKDVRHNLTDIIAALNLSDVIKSRNIEEDVGKKSSSAELKRTNIEDIFYANAQRVKESIRVLEEFTKLFPLKNTTLCLKKLRYRFYALEKKIIEKL